MKKTLALVLVLVMAISCCSGIFAAVAETSAEPFWVTHYDDYTAEGAGMVLTEDCDYGIWDGAWCDHYAFKPIEGVENGYELVDLSYGTIADGDASENGKGHTLEVPAGGFVYVTSIGNDYPSIGMDGPNYVNDNCNAQISRCRTWKVGDQFIITGLDLAGKTVPTTTPDTPWYDDSYVCTATIEAYEAANTPAEPTNVALGKKYVTSPLFRQGGADAGWGWDENANIAYPDTDGVELTDGIFPSNDATYSDPAFFGFSGSPDYNERGYAYIRVDLEKEYDLSKLVLYVGSSGVGAGIGASGMTVSYYKVDDLEGTNPVELGSVEAVDDSSAAYVPVPLETEVTARFIEIRIVRGGWMFITEFEAYTGAPAEGPVEPEPEDPSVSVTVINGDVNYNEDALGKLVDGDRDLGATAFGSAGLTYFQNPGFRDGNATVEITIDLGEVKTVGSVYADFFRDDNDTTGSFISLPSAVAITVSADGKDYYDVNAGNAIAIAAGTDLAMNTIAVDFTTRVALKVRYIKAVVTFDNEWIFLSEIGVGAASENGVPLDPAAPFAYTEGETPRFGIGLYTAAGDYDLSNNAEGTFFQSAQIVVAAWDAATKAYKISKNAVNPWPDGHNETITLSEGEILMAITTQGNINAGNELDTIYAGLKWLVRGMKVGDYVVLDTENETASFYPSTHDFGTTTEPEPDVESLTVHFTQQAYSSTADCSLTVFPAGDEDLYIDSGVANMRWTYAMAIDADGTIVRLGRNLLSEAQDTNNWFEYHGITVPAGGFGVVFHCGDGEYTSDHEDLQAYFNELLAAAGYDSYAADNTVLDVSNVGWQAAGLSMEGGEYDWGYVTFYKGKAPSSGNTEIVEEEITVDGDLDDTGYTKAEWIENGHWQNSEIPDEDISAKYTVRTDDERIYVAIEIDGAIAPNITDDYNPDTFAQNSATNLRVWFKKDAETRTFFDLQFNGEKFIFANWNTTHDAVKDNVEFVVNYADGKLVAEISVPMADLGIEDSFYLLVSYCENFSNGYNALHLTTAEALNDPDGGDNAAYWTVGNTYSYTYYTVSDIALGSYESVVEPEPEPENPEEPTNLALGKPYTGADPSTLPACAAYNAKLTDGKVADALSFDAGVWFAYYNNASATGEGNINAPNGVGQMVIDLQKVSHVELVRVHMFLGSNSGILPPQSVAVAVSNDGETFTPFGDAQTFTAPEAATGTDMVDWVVFSADAVNARYVQITIRLNGIFAFLDEVEVYNADPSESEPEPEEPCEHVNVVGRIVEATCTEDGYAERICQDCGEVLSHDVIPALGHDYVDGVCTRCGEEDPDYTAPTEPKKGDINGDGVIDPVDYLLVKRAVLGTFNLTDEQKALADINGDGKVDSVDYLLVKRAVLGMFVIE